VVGALKISEVKQFSCCFAPGVHPHSFVNCHEKVGFFSPDNILASIVHTEKVDFVLMKERDDTCFVIVLDESDALVVSAEVQLEALTHNCVVQLELHDASVNNL
jgi:hypothetical protein